MERFRARYQQTGRHNAPVPDDRLGCAFCPNLRFVHRCWSEEVRSSPIVFCWIEPCSMHHDAAHNPVAARLTAGRGYRTLRQGIRTAGQWHSRGVCARFFFLVVSCPRCSAFWELSGRADSVRLAALMGWIKCGGRVCGWRVE